VRVSFLLLYFSPVTSTLTKHNSIRTTQALIAFSSTSKSLLDSQVHPHAGSHSFALCRDVAHHFCLSVERLHTQCALELFTTTAHLEPMLAYKQLRSHSCTNGACAFADIVRYATGGNI
jgi:hypothetical protein